MVQPQGYDPEAGEATEYTYNDPYGAPAADGGYPSAGAHYGEGGSPPDTDFLSVPYSTAVTLDPSASVPFPAPGVGPSAYAPAPPFDPAPRPYASSPGAGSQRSGVPGGAQDLYKKTSSWAASKGYGWLLEVDDDDEDDTKPLLEELDINLVDIFTKVKAVLLPYGLRPADPKLTEPDFWGPFFIVLLYSSLILWGQLKVVSWVFTLWLTGSFGVYFLTRVFGGGEGGYAVTLAVTGYSLIPLVVLAAILPFIGALGVLRVVLKVLHTLWSTYAAQTLLQSAALRGRHALVAYPLALLYGYFVSLHGGV